MSGRTGYKTSFRWRRKAGGKVSRSTQVFSENDGDDAGSPLDNDDIDWLTLAPRRKALLLEDAIVKSNRLKEEGFLLLNSERYWEAIRKWDEAIQLTPEDEKLYEMKAQVLMVLCEVFPAVHTAEKAVSLNPKWWIAYQTLGRAQLGLGEVQKAIIAFSKAIHLNPADKEIWEEDMKWAHSLLLQKREMEKKQTANKPFLTDLNDAADVQVSQQKLSLAWDTKSKKTLKSLPRNYVLMRCK